MATKSTPIPLTSAQVEYLEIVKNNPGKYSQDAKKALIRLSVKKLVVRTGSSSFKISANGVKAIKSGEGKGYRVIR